MSFYGRMGAMVARQLASDKFSDAVLTRAHSANSGASFNFVTGEVIPGPTEATEVPCRALAATITTKAADGALVTNTRLMLSVEPREGDTLTLGSTNYTVGAVSKEARDGDALIYTAMAAK